MTRSSDKADLNQIIKKFSGVKILVIGDIMIDRFLWGKVSRISPEAPVPVVVVEKETFLLGGAANVVNNIRSLNGRASICGVLGDDELGQRILKELKEKGIESGGVFLEPGRQTTVKTRVIAHHHPYQQQLVRIDRETTDHPRHSTLRSLSSFVERNLGAVDGAVISDYGKGLLTRTLIQKIIQDVQKQKKFVMVDPKPKNFSFYRGSTVVTPNAKEASEASGIPIVDRASLKKAGRILLDKLRCEALVVTRGEEGMTIFKPRQDPIDVATVARDVYDVTGAGDTVIGTMALARGAGASVEIAATLANYAAGIVVGKMGTATVDRKELWRAVREKPRPW
jgi:D-beta-D-heptose 7-phosphate kinase/D-beta-D-heptose 1-phosphate adenosyltransferase